VIYKNATHALEFLKSLESEINQNEKREALTNAELHDDKASVPLMLKLKSVYSTKGPDLADVRKFLKSVDLKSWDEDQVEALISDIANSKWNTEEEE